MHFDIQSLVVGISGAILGIGGVSTFLGKYMPVAKKYIGIAKDAIDLNDALLVAVEDDKITDQEFQNLKVKALKLKDDFKK